MPEPDHSVVAGPAADQRLESQKIQPEVPKPIVGETVWFYDPLAPSGVDNGIGVGPYAAIVIQSWPGPYVNLRVLGWNGRCNVGSVPHIDDPVRTSPDQRYWTWPPFSRGART